MEFTEKSFVTCERVIREGRDRYITFRLIFGYGHMLEFSHVLPDYDEFTPKHRGFVESTATAALALELRHALDTAQDVRLSPQVIVAKLPWRAIWLGIKLKLFRRGK